MVCIPGLQDMLYFLLMQRSKFFLKMIVTYLCFNIFKYTFIRIFQTSDTVMFRRWVSKLKRLRNVVWYAQSLFLITRCLQYCCRSGKKCEKGTLTTKSPTTVSFRAGGGGMAKCAHFSLSSVLSWVMWPSFLTWHVRRCLCSHVSGLCTHFRTLLNLWSEVLLSWIRCLLSLKDTLVKADLSSNQVNETPTSISFHVSLEISCWLHWWGKLFL